MRSLLPHGQGFVTEDRAPFLGGRSITGVSTPDLKSTASQADHPTAAKDGQGFEFAIRRHPSNQIQVHA
jgi:hypothetical protein